MSESGLSNDDEIKVDLVQDGRWTREEHFCFLKAVAIYGREVCANPSTRHTFHRCVSTISQHEQFKRSNISPTKPLSAYRHLSPFSGNSSKLPSKLEPRPKSEATHKSTSRNVRSKSSLIQQLAYQRMLSLF